MSDIHTTSQTLHSDDEINVISTSLREKNAKEMEALHSVPLNKTIV